MNGAITDWLTNEATKFAHIYGPEYEIVPDWHQTNLFSIYCRREDVVWGEFLFELEGDNLWMQMVFDQTDDRHDKPWLEPVRVPLGDPASLPIISKWIDKHMRIAILG